MYGETYGDNLDSNTVDHDPIVQKAEEELKEMETAYIDGFTSLLEHIHTTKSVSKLSQLASEHATLKQRLKERKVLMREANHKFYGDNKENSSRE